MGSKTQSVSRRDSKLLVPAPAPKMFPSNMIIYDTGMDVQMEQLPQELQDQR